MKHLLLIIMALGITINGISGTTPIKYRNDSTVFPRIDISGYDDAPYIKLSDWQYFEAKQDSFLLEPNNRSMIECPVVLRNCFYEGDQDWLTETGSIIVTSPNDGWKKTSGASEGWDGAYYDDSLTGDTVSIQAEATSTMLSAGISLQDNNPAIHNFFLPTVAHAIIFGQNGQLSIREKGVVPKGYTSQYSYEVGDTAMIELIGLIVRYYLIKPDGRMIILRTTRSKLLFAPTASVMLYFPNSEVINLRICAGPEAKATFENIGVARRKDESNNVYGQKTKTETWQKWKNVRSRVSTADPIQLADGEFEYTFPSSKTVLRQIALTPKSYNFAGFQNIEDFFNWHGNEKNFIFVDEARKDIYGNPQEFWSRFLGGITDESGNGCIFDYGVQIIEAYRGDYIPKQLDTIAPTCVLDVDNDTEDEIATLTATATDNQEIRYVQFFNNGNKIFGLDITSLTDEYEISFGYDSFPPGTYVLQAKAIDYAGNTTDSNIVNLVIT